MQTELKKVDGGQVRQKEILDRLRAMIWEGAFVPGQSLPEVRLSALLEVSRTPVREALVALEHEGLVVYRQNRGYVVRQFTLDEILSAHTVREVLEGLGCRLLAESGMEPSVERKLRNCLTEADALFVGGNIGSSDLSNWRALNSEFHRTIYEATGNEYLVGMANSLMVPLVTTRIVFYLEDPVSSAKPTPRRRPRLFDDSQVLRSHEDHHAIFEAISKRQSARAEAVMREHIHRATWIIRENYERLHGGEKK